MAMTLLEKAQQVLEEKKTKVIPENIKEKVTIFGIDGIFNGKRSNIKMFNSIDEMNADSDKMIGDTALVYGDAFTKTAPEIRFSKMKFLKNATLNEIYEGGVLSASMEFDGVDYYMPSAHLRENHFEIEIREQRYTEPTYDDEGFMIDPEMPYEIDVACATWYSSDGYHYTLDSYSGNGIFDVDENTGDVIWTLPEGATGIFEGDKFYSQCEKFFELFVLHNFSGIYECLDGEIYSVAKTQLTIKAENVFGEFNSFYGINGVEQGTLDKNLSTSFNYDVPSTEVYNNIQMFYNNMTPLVATNNNKYGGLTKGKLHYIPCKSDGTPLLDTSQVTNMDKYFLNTDIQIIPKLNTSNVTSAKSMFQNSDLTYLSPIDTSKITDATRMFSGCGKLEYVPVLDLSSVTTVNYMFAICTSLSDEALNNIMYSLANSNVVSTLKAVGFYSTYANRCKNLSNYDMFIASGWTTGY